MIRVVSGVAAALALTMTLSSLAAEDARYRLKPGATGRVCLSCHVDFQDTLAMSSVHTPVRAGQCADCHDPHASDHGKLLAAEPTAICLRCHDDVAPASPASAHRAVIEGRCVDCHDPHASPHRNLLRSAGNALCLECHRDLAEALEGAAHRHAPVEQDCLGCHSPHASADAPALLVKTVASLCVGCHDPKASSFARNHAGYAVGRADCTSCHDPHGSSSAGLLWASVHEPVSRRMCGQCHVPPEEAGGARTRREGSELCRGCHNELFQETSARGRRHGPLVDPRGCANCHEPHASKHDALLSATQGTLCAGCHPDTVRRQAKSAVKHEPIAAGACGTCHEPHAADEAALLSGPVVEVCGACHEWRKHSAHPMGPDIVDPRNPNLSVDCLSCHRAHGTEHDHMTYFDPRQELCMQCHQEFAR